MNFNEEEFRKLEQSDDLLFEAYNEPLKSKAIKLARKSLEINPNNIDAENFITKFETNTIKKLEKYKSTLDKEHKKLEEDGDFDKKYIGMFWGITETRPYMRTRLCYMQTLMELGRYSEAIKQAEESLKLCENDNQGIRYILMGLYAFLERFEECKKLYKKYLDSSSFMLLPLSIMYYKEGDYRKAKKILKEIQEKNRYLLGYIKQNFTFSKTESEYYEREGAYSFGTESEAYFIMRDYKYLLETVPTFKEFIEREIK